MDIMHLRLLADISERSPVTLWTVGNVHIFASLFRNTIGKLHQKAVPPEHLEAFLGALCQVGVAYEKSKKFTTAQSVHDMEKMITAQFDVKTANVDPSSPAAELGKKYLPSILDSLDSLVSSGCNHVHVLTNCMAHLSTCSVQCPSILLGDEQSLWALVRSCMSIGQLTNHVDDRVSFLRLSALDVLASVSSVPQIKRSLLKPNRMSPQSVLWIDPKSPLVQFLIMGNDGPSNPSDQRGIFYICAELATIGVDDDEEEWSIEPASLYDSESSWENDQIALHAESVLESFVEALGGALALPSIFQLVDSLLSSQSWKSHRAVLSILECCLAAAPVSFAPHVRATVETALHLSHSSSPRVQYQALQLLGSLCCANTVETDDSAKTDQKTLVRETFSRSILECVSRLTHSPCSKVSSHACLTIVSYCRGGNGVENCLIPINKELVLPYVGELLEALRSGPLSLDISRPASVTQGSLTVLDRAIGAVACLADAVGDDFLPYYGIMNGLKSCIIFGLETSEEGVVSITAGVKNTHEMTVLRGTAIEAGSIVGQAISGPNSENVATFIQDASDIMNIATKLILRDDVVPTDQVLNACARIAAVLGSQYIPFVPVVLPHLLKRAREKVEVSIEDGDIVESNETFSVTIPGIGRKVVKISTTQLESKTQAARAIYEHARALGADFGPFVESSANAFIPLISCEYSGEVRSTSSQAVAQIFKSACLFAARDCSNRTEKLLPETLLPMILIALVKQLLKENDEDEIENRYAIADALSEVMYDAYVQKDSNGNRVAEIKSSDARGIVPDIVNLIQSCLSRRMVLLSETTGMDFDELARCRRKTNAEAELLTHLVDSIGFQLKSLGVQFLPIFDEHIAGTLGKYLTAAGTMDVRARHAAICLFDDCIEFCGPQAVNTYAPALLVAVMEGTIVEDDDLKQAAIYGIAQMARYAPLSIPVETGKELLMRVFNIAKVVQNSNKSDLDNLAVVENAISAIASLALLPGSPLFDNVTEKQSLLNVFLMGLPLSEDYDEAKICHEGLCSMVDAGIVKLQSDYGMLIKIIGGILALVADEEEVATDSTCSRLVEIAREIIRSVDGDAIQTVLSSLEPQSQQSIISVLH